MSVVALSSLDHLIDAWGSTPSLDEQAAFLRLRSDQREVALRRIAILQGLTSQGRPSTRDQLKAAEALGLSHQRLRGLLLSWKSPSVAIAVPHGKKVQRRSRENHGRDIAVRIVAKALRKSPDIAEPTVHRRVAKICQRLRIAPPARMTVRGIIENQRNSRKHKYDQNEHGAIQYRSERHGRFLLLIEQQFDLTILKRERHASAQCNIDLASALMLLDVTTEAIIAAVPLNEADRLGINARHFVDETASIFGWSRPNLLVVATDDHKVPLLSQFERNARRQDVTILRRAPASLSVWMEQFWRWDLPLRPVVKALSANQVAELPSATETQFTKLLQFLVRQHNFKIEAMMPQKEQPSQTELALTAAALFALFNTEKTTKFVE